MKALCSSLKHFIVQKLQIPNQEAIAHILAERVLVNNQKGLLNQELLPEDEVRFNHQILKAATNYTYLAYYKPRGIESTLNPAIENNLLAALNIPQKVFPVGRLDKESEGLLLLTDNGKIYDAIIHAESHQEKEYQVTVAEPLTPEALQKLATGVEIMGQKTRPAVVTPANAQTFNIILTEGRNRQIRRMCYKLGYTVTQLIRIRIITLHLGNLNPGEWRHLTLAEVTELQEKVLIAS